jgi:oligopeptide/dipeptide ABC transporter ATP-binding protein
MSRPSVHSQATMAANQAAAPASERVPTLRVQDLAMRFPIRKGLLSQISGHVHAVDGISLTLHQGETLGLVGESGCGKSTVGKTVLRLNKPTAGRIELMGQDITNLSRRALRPLRRHMQMVFQDPFASLNPRMSAGQIVAEPLATHGIGTRRDRPQQVAALFQRVGLRPEQMADFPHQFSGGQRQRIAIARALAVNPSLIVGDEPVSALDVSIQAQMINLLMDLQDEYRLSYIFIAHDLAVVERISHRIAVMYLGRIVELASARDLLGSPLHPYTEALLEAVPVPEPKATRRRRTILEGDVPSPINPPAGCRFHTRCPRAMDRCRVEDPKLREIKPEHYSACHLNQVAYNGGS